MKGWSAVGLAVVAGSLGLACSDGAEDKRDSAETRAIMSEIFGEIQKLLPLSVDPHRLADPALRPQVEQSLATLALNAGLLEEHTAHRDAEMRFLARSTARDAREARRAYDEDRFDRSAFLLEQITENCIVCHTRLPSAKDSKVAQGFVDRAVFDALDLESRAALLTATRRFDEALDTLDTLLESPKPPALLLGPLTDYLVLSIRVKGDYERPARTLRRFAERPDLWTQLRADVDAWVDALPGLEKKTSGKPSLATARALLDEGRAMAAFPQDRAWLANYVAASGVLQRLIEARPKPGPELAEAYYLLGTTEAAIGRNYWVTPAPFLLETSIRLAPGEPFARRAFALLEQELLMNYEGSDFEEIPPDERRKLDELQSLLDDAGS